MSVAYSTNLTYLVFLFAHSLSIKEPNQTLEASTEQNIVGFCRPDRKITIIINLCWSIGHCFCADPACRHGVSVPRRWGPHSPKVRSQRLIPRPLRYPPDDERRSEPHPQRLGLGLCIPDGALSSRGTVKVQLPFASNVNMQLRMWMLRTIVVIFQPCG
jgi:hypothetical protein